MTLHVNIGEAKTRLSELVAAALRGEEVILNKAGRPVARLVPEQSAVELEREAIAAKRRRCSALGPTSTSICRMMRSTSASFR
jgi:prevent-host-death family protein